MLFVFTESEQLCVLRSILQDLGN